MKTIYDFTCIKNGAKTKAFPLIGKGTARKVYDLNNGYVAKIAIGQKGISQNETESDLSGDTYMKLFAEVQSHNEDYSIIIMEKCKRVKSIKALKILLDKGDGQDLEENWNDIQNELILNYDLGSDSNRISSWGMDKDGNVKLVDYGCTIDVWRKHYR